MSASYPSRTASTTSLPAFPFSTAASGVTVSRSGGLSTTAAAAPASSSGGGFGMPPRAVLTRSVIVAYRTTDWPSTVAFARTRNAYAPGFASSATISGTHAAGRPGGTVTEPPSALSPSTLSSIGPANPFSRVMVATATAVPPPAGASYRSRASVTAKSGVAGVTDRWYTSFGLSNRADTPPGTGSFVADFGSSFGSCSTSSG